MRSIQVNLGRCQIACGTASGNLIQSNKIGTNAGGTAAIPNGGDGIFINNAPNNTIGGTAAGAGNRISGNWFFGIQLFGPLTSGNAIQGNIISGNRVGRILVNTNRFANQIDGAGPGQANQDQARPIFSLARRARSGRDR
jgi:parallel beta-helix repeat protein